MGEHEDNLFGELRSMVHGERSQRAFDKLCVWAEQLERASPGAFSPELLAYAKEILETWSPHTTSLTMQCYEPERVASVPWLPMIGGVTLNGFARQTVWQVAEQLALLPPLKHIGLDGLPIRQKDFLDAIEDGLFDGVRSLEIRNCPLRTQTFEPLIERLAEREALADLEELRFHNCNIKSKHLEVLCESSLPERLRVLGLSNNTSLKTAGAKVLLPSLPKFAKLERLLLEDTGLNNAAAKLIASATLPQTLTHIGLGGNKLKAAGLKALAKVGRARMLADRTGEHALNTAYFAFDDASLRACLEDGMLDDVARWEMTGWEASLPSIDMIRTEADLSALRAIDFRYFAIEEQDAFAALIESLEALDELYCGPHTDEMMIRLLNAPALQQARYLSFGESDPRGPEALRAFLDWPGFEDAVVSSARFEVQKGSDEHRRALESGVFYEDHVADNTVYLSSHKRYEQEQEDVCVYGRGRLSSKWIIKHAWNH